MFKKTKIRQKFFFIGTIAIISLLTLGWLSFKINKQNYFDISSVFSDFSTTYEIQSSYIDPLFLFREKTLMAFIPASSINDKQINIEIMSAIKTLDHSYIRNESNTEQYWKAYKKQVLVTRKFINNNEVDKAYKHVTTIERDLFLILIKRLKEAQKTQLQESENTYLIAIKSNNQSLYYLIFGFFFIGLLSFIFNISIVMKIVNAIEKMDSGIKRFLSYLANPKQSSKNVTIDINTEDELGTMARAINEQVNAIKLALEKDSQVIEEATCTLKELQEGQFGTRLLCDASSKELNTLKSVMNRVMDNLEGKIKEEINQRLSQEQTLAEQSKLAAMGNILGNVAHQWRQPISEISSVLMGTEAMLRYGNIDKEKFISNIELCNKITEHMSNTISDFQSFFNPSKKKEEFDVYTECQRAVSIISASFESHHIELEFNVEASATIYGYPREFAHAILNILSNSKDVLLEREIKEPKVIFEIKVGKEYTIIHIEDNAGGIHLEDVNAVFEPYFTTKHAKQGTGIGLHMTKTMIENNMQGHIRVHNTEKGACFTIKIK